MSSSQKIKSWFSYRLDDIKYDKTFFIKQLIVYFCLADLVIFSYFYPGFLSQIPNLRYYLILLISYLTINAVVMMVLHAFNKGLYFSYTGYIGTITYIILIYLITGGVNSSYVFMLSFIPIISIAFLNAKLTRNVGIVSIILLVSLIVFGGNEDPTFLIKQVLNILGFSLVVYLIYKLSKEILFQKFEKEHYKRQFIDLMEVEKTKETFITAISHQLRTPLNGAKWAVQEVLEHQECPEKELLKEGYDKIVESINIVGEMLKSTDLDKNKDVFKLNKERIDLYSVIDNILKNLSFLIKANGIDLVYNKKKGLNIFADRKTLDLGLTNIFDNAFRYSPKSQVIVSLDNVGKDARLTIQDHGIGIDPIDMEHMFQKFFRGKNAVAIDPNESGVGLYATKKIIEMHDGNIKLNSVLGKGTTFEIFIPLVD
jgi:signal transduction histidine kinase